jgi:N-acetylneuraminic acid mutarotase
MKKLLLLLLAVSLCAEIGAGAEDAIHALPVPITNNAVAFLKVKKRTLLFSFMGLGAKKTWNAITNAAYMFDSGTGKWEELRSVPGPAGRVGASAIGARAHVFVLGGYTADAQGAEITVRDDSVYDPTTRHWYRAADLPAPIDDSVVGVYKDRYLYVVSGWSRDDAVNQVQIYDAEKNTWTQGTPIPGRAVFGHAGGLVEDTIVYVDGAYKNPAGKPQYIASDECWMGKIDKKDLTKITWTKLPPHPGPARYRIAAGSSEHDRKIYFTGGTDNPYNLNGIGYDGKPSEPSETTFAFNVKSGEWETVYEDTPYPTMDHRGLLVTSEGLITVGGMDKGQEVTARVAVIPRK